MIDTLHLPEPAQATQSLRPALEILEKIFIVNSRVLSRAGNTCHRLSIQQELIPVSIAM